MDFSNPGKVIFSMIEYIERLVAESPEDLLKGPCATPAANHLFHVNDKAEPLSKHDAEVYHHLTAMLLYLAQKKPVLTSKQLFLFFLQAHRHQLLMIGGNLVDVSDTFLYC